MSNYRQKTPDGEYYTPKNNNTQKFDIDTERNCNANNEYAEDKHYDLKKRFFKPLFIIVIIFATVSFFIYGIWFFENTSGFVKSKIEDDFTDRINISEELINDNYIIEFLDFTYSAENYDRHQDRDYNGFHTSFELLNLSDKDVKINFDKSFQYIIDDEAWSIKETTIYKDDILEQDYRFEEDGPQYVLSPGLSYSIDIVLINPQSDEKNYGRYWRELDIYYALTNKEISKKQMGHLDVAREDYEF